MRTLAVALSFILIASIAAPAAATVVSHAEKPEEVETPPATASPENGQRSGVAIPLPDSSKEEAMEMQEQLTNQFNIESRTNATLLFGRDGPHTLVFTDEPIKPGNITAEGALIKGQTVGTDLDFVFADSLEVDQTGHPIELDSLRESPSQYRNEVVQVTANYSQVAVELDSDSGVRSSTSAGYLTETSVLGSGVMDTPIIGAMKGTLNTSSSDLGSNSSQAELYRMLQVFSDARTGLPVEGITDQMWMQGEVTVDLLVLKTGNSMSYIVVNTTPASTSATVSEASKHEDEVVRINGQYVGGKLSTREVLLKSLRCAPDSIANPATGCFPLVTDTTVHAGMLLDGRDSVPVVGLSNKRVDGAVQDETGEMVVYGRIVNADEVAVEVDSPVVLVAYKMQRKGDLTITGDSRQKARDLANKFESKVRESLVQQAQDEPNEWGAQANEKPESTTTTAGTTDSGAATTATTAGSSEGDAQQENSENDQDNSELTAAASSSGGGMLTAMVSLLTSPLVSFAYGLLAVVSSVSGVVIGSVWVYKINRDPHSVSTSPNTILSLTLGAVPFYFAAGFASGVHLMSIIGGAIVFVIGLGYNLVLLYQWV